MKQIITLLLMLLLSVSFTQVIGAQEKVVTSKILEVSDVQNSINTGKLNVIFDGRNPFGLEQTIPNSIKILGVHQEGKTATIYIVVDLTQKVGGAKRIPGMAKIVQFNSGEWFCPGSGQFLVK